MRIKPRRTGAATIAALLGCGLALGCSSGGPEADGPAEDGPLGHSHQALLGPLGEYVVSSEATVAGKGTSDGNLAATRTYDEVFEVLTETRATESLPYRLDHTWYLDGVPTAGELKVIVWSRIANSLTEQLTIQAVAADAKGVCGRKWVTLANDSSTPTCGPAACGSTNARRYVGALASGRSSTRICVRATDTVQDTDTTASVFELNYIGAAIGLPDLVVDSISGPASVAPGETATFQYTLKNVGAASTPFGFNTKLACWMPFVADTIQSRLFLGATAGDVSTFLQRGEIWGTPAYLAPGATTTQTATFTVPMLQEGPRYFSARVNDPTGSAAGFCGGLSGADVSAVVEASTGNNIGTMPFTVAWSDIFLASATTSPTGSLAPGQTVTVTAVVNNLGPGLADNALNTIKAFASDDTVFDASDSLLGSAIPASDIAAGGSASVTLQGTLPGGVATGPKYIILIDENAYDRNAANNKLVVPVQIELPDISVVSAGAPTTGVTPGQSIALTASITNVGLSSTLSTPIMAYVSSDAAYDATDVSIGTATTGIIAPGATTSVAFSGTLPAVLPAGQQYLILRAEPASDANLSNNTAAAPILVHYPDLSVTGASTSPSGHLVTGQAFRVSASVTNLGPAIAIPAVSPIQFYLSSDSAYDAADVLIGTAQLASNLNAGASCAVAATAFLPPDMQSGSQFVLVRAEASVDGNRSNDLQAVAVSVIAADTPASVEATDLGTVPDNYSDHYSLSFSPDGSTLAVSSESNVFGPPKLISVTTGVTRTPSASWQAWVTYMPGGAHVLGTPPSRVMTLSDATTLEPIRAFGTSTQWVPPPVAVSGDGRRIYGPAESIAPFVVADPVTGAILSKRSTSGSAPSLNHDGTRLIDSSASLFDTTTPTVTLVRNFASGLSVRSTDFSPDGTKVLASTHDGFVYVWETATGTQLAKLPHGGPVPGAEFLPDGNAIVSYDTSAHSMVLLWDLQTREILQAFSRAGNEVKVEGLGVSRTGSRIAVAYADGKIMIWPTGRGTAEEPNAVLTLGQPIGSTVLPHVSQTYAVDVEAGQPLVLSVDGSPTDVAYLTADSPALLVSAVHVATGTPADALTTTPAGVYHAEVPITPTKSGRYLMTVSSPYLTAGSIQASVKAEINPFHFSEVTPRAIANAGDVTVSIRGTGLSGDTMVRLVAPSNDIVKAHSIAMRDRSRVYATFSMAGATSGAYRLEIEDPVTHALEVIPGAVTVAPGIAGQFSYQLVGPASVRPQRLYDFSIAYENAGDTDVPAPFVFVSSVEADALRTPYGTTATRMAWLAAANDWPSHVLPPRAKGRIKFTGYFKDFYDLTPLVATEDSTPFNWTATQAGWPPSTLSALLQQEARIGGTNAEVFASMRKVARDLTGPVDFGLLMQFTVIAAQNGGLDY